MDNAKGRRAFASSPPLPPRLERIITCTLRRATLPEFLSTGDDGGGASTSFAELSPKLRCCCCSPSRLSKGSFRASSLPPLLFDAIAIAVPSPPAPATIYESAVGLAYRYIHIHTRTGGLLLFCCLGCLALLPCLFSHAPKEEETTKQGPRERREEETKQTQDHRR